MNSEPARPELNESADGPVRARSLVIVVAVATAVGAALRFLNIDRPELWLDESCTWYFTQWASPFDFRTDYILRDNTSRLYYMLVAGWTAVFGDMPAGMRSFSALVGTLTIPLVALWLRSVAGNAPAAIGSALVAVHPLHVYYSREARFYPLWMVELIGLLWCGWLAARTDRWRYWAGYAACFLAALWTHYFTLFFAPVALALPLLWPAGRPRRRCWLIANAAVAAVFLPWFLAIVVPVASRGSGDWVADMFRGYPPAAAVPRTFAAFAPAGVYPDYTSYLHRVSRSSLPASILGLACMLAAAVAFALPSRRHPPLLPARDRIFYLCSAIAPLVFAWTYSVVRAPIYLVGRYDQVVWPAVMVIVSVGLVELARRIREGGAALLATGACAVASAVAISAREPFAVLVSAEPRRELIHYMMRNYRPGDCVIAFGATQWDLCYYRAALWPDASSFRGFPASMDEQVGWVSHRRQLADPAALRREAIARAAELRRDMSPGSTIWLLLQAYNVARGPDDPAFQIDFMMDRALKAAGAVDRPTDQDLPLYAMIWPSAATQTRNVH